MACNSPSRWNAPTVGAPAGVAAITSFLALAVWRRPADGLAPQLPGISAAAARRPVGSFAAVGTSRRSYRRPRVALVLGAGGSVGHAYHLGVLAALEHELGWDARTAGLVVGTSAGSIVGAGLRAGIGAADLYAYSAGGRPSAEASDMIQRGQAAMNRAHAADDADGDSRGGRRLRVASPERLMRALREPWKASPGSMLSAVLPAGKRPTAYLGAPYDDMFGTEWPTAPLWVVAVRLDRGDRTVFGRDRVDISVGRAVEASCAVPAYFAPVEIDGERYVDGGVHSTTNADLVADEKPDLVIVSAPMSGTNAASEVSPRSAVRQFARRSLTAELDQLSGAGIEVVVFEPTVDDFAVMAGNTMDPGKAPAVCAQVRRSTTAALHAAELADRLAPLTRS